MCVSTSPYSFYIPVSSYSGRATSLRIPLLARKELKTSKKKLMKTSEFCFSKVSRLRPSHPLFSIANIQSHSSTKTASWHELSKFSYLKPILWLRKVDFEKLGLIPSSHISADAPFHAESEFALAFDEKCLARPIMCAFCGW